MSDVEPSEHLWFTTRTEAGDWAWDCACGQSGTAAYEDAACEQGYKHERTDRASLLTLRDAAEVLASAVEDFVFTTEKNMDRLRAAWQSYVETADAPSSSRTNGDQETTDG